MNILKCLKSSPKTAGQLATKLRAPKLQIYRALGELVADGKVYVKGLAVDAHRRGPKARVYAVAVRR